MGTTTETDPRWARVLARDATADGALWYSVATTGVYCRPSCPSRRANRANVTLHDSLAEAQATGFRPCKRCNPDGPSAQATHGAMIARACRMIEAGEAPPKLADLATAQGLSQSHFHRLFKAFTGLTPRAYAAGHRAERLRANLAAAASVTEAIYEAGFNSSGRFYEQAGAMLGMAPARYKGGGMGEELHFAIGQSALGAILVASSTKGVVAILMGDDPDALARELQDRFTKARLIGDDVGYATLVARVIGLIEAPGVGFDLPLDLRGTAFQQRVWQALRAIPLGETVSYSQLAAKIGAPGSARAVARACATNHVAVAIPCHRVVRQDGALSGYAWGVERKRALLLREGAKV